MYVTDGERMLRARRGHRTADLALPAAAVRRDARAPAAPTAAPRWRAIACSWRPTTRTSSPSTASPATLLWDTEMADSRKSYFATSAPLVAGNLVVAGIGGGEHGTRGFVAAYDQTTGKEAWRFWTVPLPGEPKSETWQGKGHRARRRADLVHRDLRPGARHRLLADRQSQRGILRRRSQAATTCIRIASWRSTRRPAS